MNIAWIKALLVALCFLGVTPPTDASPITGQPSAETPAEAGQSQDAVTWSQVAMVVACIVLVLLVLLLIGGFLIHAAENETPEQKLRRKRDQQEIAGLVVAASVTYAMTEALKKLK